MADCTAFARQIDNLEEALREISLLTVRDDLDSRRELIHLRRKLADEIAYIGSTGEATFAGMPELLEFRAKYSLMRSSAAMRQAAWPAVIIGERPEDFQASVAPLRRANREFIEWARATVKRLGR